MSAAHVTNVRPKPAVGQLWWDKDDRVTSQYARIVDVALDGVFIRRGKNGEGHLSRVSPANLHKRFLFVEEHGA